MLGPRSIIESGASVAAWTTVPPCTAVHAHRAIVRPMIAGAEGTVPNGVLSGGAVAPPQNRSAMRGRSPLSSGRSPVLRAMSIPRDNVKTHNSIAGAAPGAATPTEISLMFMGSDVKRYASCKV